MPESKKRPAKKSGQESAKAARKRLARIDPRAPWKRAWWVLWGFITVVGELILIFLTRSGLVHPSTLQLGVIAVCIPFVIHLLISGIRTLLFVTSR